MSTTWIHSVIYLVLLGDAHRAILGANNRSFEIERYAGSLQSCDDDLVTATEVQCSILCASHGKCLGYVIVEEGEQSSGCKFCYMGRATRFEASSSQALFFNADTYLTHRGQYWERQGWLLFESRLQDGMIIKISATIKRSQRLVTFSDTADSSDASVTFDLHFDINFWNGNTYRRFRSFLSSYHSDQWGTYFHNLTTKDYFNKYHEFEIVITVHKTHYLFNVLNKGEITFERNGTVPMSNIKYLSVKADDITISACCSP